MANASVIRKVMATITDQTLNTSVYAMQDNEVWSGDLAGHAVAFAGMNLVWRSDVLWDDQDRPRSVQVAHRTVANGEIPDAAASVLDLTPAQAKDIFYADAETVDQLWEIVTQVTGVTR